MQCSHVPVAVGVAGGEVIAKYRDDGDIKINPNPKTLLEHHQP